MENQLKPTINIGADIKEIPVKLPVSGKEYTMVRSTGTIQEIAERQFSSATQPFKFQMSCIAQTLTPAPATLEEITSLCNEDLDWLLAVYSKYNRTGKFAITDKEVDDFFGNLSSPKQ